MTAPVDEAVVEPAGPVSDGEFPINLPVMVIEQMDTSDGRLLTAGSLSHRALPLSLLAQPESMHGGSDAGPAGIVGRIDTMTRVLGPEVISKRTGKPFPEGTFVWSGTGHMSATAKVGGYDVADMFRKGHLRGISVDLAGMDYEVLGDESPVDPEFPRRQLIVHGAEVAAATLVPIPAYADAYAEMADGSGAMVPADDAALAASASPSWRSAEVGDYSPARAALIAAADEGMPVRIPADSVEQLSAVIDSGEQRDAPTLATAIVEHIAQNWAATAPVTEDELPEAGDMAAQLADETLPEAPAEDEGLAAEGDPAEPQACIYSGPDNDHPATMSLLYQDGGQFVSVCADDEQRARDELEKAGETVSDVVPIEGGEPAAEDAGDAVVAAANVADLPDISVFQRPDFTGLTPTTVANDDLPGGFRHVCGHLAGWGKPHRGLTGYTTAPRSRTGYSEFLLHAARVRDGDTVRTVAVGNITMGTGHAGLSLNLRDTVEHYDSSGSIVAQVAVGEDEWGIWYSGVVLPDVDELRLRRFMSCGLSGDWRELKSRGGLELCAALAIPVPGFSAPRARVASGAPRALVAAGAVLPVEPASLDVDALADLLAEKLDARRTAGELSVKHADLVAQLDDTPTVVAALLAEVDDSPTRMAALFAELDHGHGAFGVLNEKPGSNWIEDLPAPLRAAWDRSIVYRAATHMHQERGMEVGHAIASALNWAKVVCSSGDVKQWKGPQSVNPKSRAECCEAIALWETMRAAAKADN